MLAILIGELSFLFGLGMVFLPVMAIELSQPRDAFWGTVFLLTGLVLITSNDRFRGAPMLAILFGAMLIGRLGFEVGLSRWQKLSEKEQGALLSWGRWLRSFKELGIASMNFGAIFSNPSVRKKKWVHPEDRGSGEPSLKLQTSSEGPLTNVEALIEDEVESSRGLDSNPKVS